MKVQFTGRHFLYRDIDQSPHLTADSLGYDKCFSLGVEKLFKKNGIHGEVSHNYASRYDNQIVVLASCPDDGKGNRLVKRFAEENHLKHVYVPLNTSDDNFLKTIEKDMPEESKVWGWPDYKKGHTLIPFLKDLLVKKAQAEKRIKKRVIELLTVQI